MVGKIGPGLRTSGFPRLKTSIGRRGIASKALDYSALGSVGKPYLCGWRLGSCRGALRHGRAWGEGAPGAEGFPVSRRARHACWGQNGLGPGAGHIAVEPSAGCALLICLSDRGETLGGISELLLNSLQHAALVHGTQRCCTSDLKPPTCPSSDLCNRTPGR